MNLHGLPLFSEMTTSMEAAEAIAPHVARLQEVVLRAIRHEPGGCTAEQLEDRTGLSGNTVRPRLIELCEAGLVVTSGETRLNRSGRRAKVYDLA